VPTTLVTGGAAPGWDMNPLLSAHTISLLGRLGVTIEESAGSADGSRVIARDWVADPTSWQIPGKEIFEVGAKVKGGRLYNATQSGFWTGTKI